MAWLRGRVAFERGWGVGWVAVRGGLAAAHATIPREGGAAGDGLGVGVGEVGAGSGRD